MNDMDRHIQQTNDRLQCIKQHLATPSGFQNAARELLEWCSDTRAFQRPFEQGLISCLTVVSRVAAQPGYDLDLGYRLLAVCAAHRDKFTPKSAAMLSLWCEDLGRLLLLRHQKNRTPESGKGAAMHPQISKNLPPVPASDSSMQWQQPNQQAPPQPGHAGQQLSVVTTVWGVTQTTQSGPFNHNPNTPAFTNTTMSNTQYTQQPPFAGNQMPHKPPFPGNPGNVPYRRDGGYSRPNGYPPTPGTPGSNPPNGGPPPGALSAAALVAAAATATATATATASMVAQIEHQQQQQGPQEQMMNINVNQYGPHGPQMPPHGHAAAQFNNQYGPPPQRPPPGMNPMGQVAPPASQASGPPGPMQRPSPGPISGKPNMAGMYQQRRPAPYPSPHQYMQNKRQQFPPNGQQQVRLPGGHVQQQYLPPQSYGPSSQQYPNKPQYPPQQQPLPSPTYPQPPGQRPGTPGYGNGQNPYINAQYQHHQPRPGPPNPGYNPQFPPQQNYPPNQMYGPHSPIPGNPTPPMTPGTNVPPYMSPGGDMKPNLADLKPQMPMKRDNDELRLTFPVRDGVVLPPFRLEHNLAVSNHSFHLRDSVYQTLMWRSDLELQLKCFHHEDRQMNTNWPASVTVSVNANPLNIERGENKTSHKPLYLKEVCQPGRNTIQITVSQCCCSHLFVLQLVHRPSVRSVLQGLLRKRLLPAEHCITKIKRNFTSVAANNNPMNGEDGVEQTAIKVSLKCPITFRRITLPARGHDCKHIQCFDLESYLQLNCERGSWRCPVCNKTALLEGLEIDQYIWAVLTSLANTEFEEVTIDQTASWKPVPLKPIKGEEPSSCGGRWMKAMSPASMQMPTMNSWDMGFQPGPQGPPHLPPTPQGGPVPYNSNYGEGGPGPGSGPHFQGTADFLGPLSHMSDNIAANDMVSVEKQLNQAHSEQQLNHGPPHHPPRVPSHSMDQGSQPLRHPDAGTPVSSGNNPSTPSMPTSCNSSQPLNHAPPQPNNKQASNSSAGDNANNQLSHNTEIGNDLNFDPAAIIEGEGQGQEGLDLLADNIGDPMELLSYLGPHDGSGATTGNNANNNNDDLLSLFDS